jgi:transcriptional regulator with XRE-family HTH domain
VHICVLKVSLEGVSKILQTARVLAGFSRPELAALAGVAPSTVLRIESGQVIPTTLMLDRLLAAAGYRIESRLVPVSDVAAVAAARGALDPSTGLSGYAGAAEWVTRWTRAGFISADGSIPEPRRLVEIAGLAASLASRPGLLACAPPPSWGAAAKQLRNSGYAWAATGGAAANRLTRSADAPWFVFYVDDPRTVAEDLGFVPTIESGPKMALIPFSGVADVGAEEDADGYRWANALQVMIDCFGGTDRMPEQAAALASLRFDVDAHV